MYGVGQMKNSNKEARKDLLQWGTEMPSCASCGRGPNASHVPGHGSVCWVLGVGVGALSQELLWDLMTFSDVPISAYSISWTKICHTESFSEEHLCSWNHTWDRFYVGGGHSMFSVFQAVNSEIQFHDPCYFPFQKRCVRMGGCLCYFVGTSR